MKITDIQAIHLRIEDPNIGLFDGSYDDCLIVVRADDGRTGIGEVESLAPAIQGVVYAPPAHNHARGLRELLLGEDPTDPERLWQRMYEATDYIGRRGLVMHALGGIDLALWDLAAQARGVPVYELLGGAKRRRVRAYGTIYPIARTPDGVRAQIQAAQALHLRAFKLCADPWWLDDLGHTARLLQAARAEAGDAALLFIDAALSYRSVEEGLRLLPIFRDVGVSLLEAPLPLDDVAGHARLAGQGIPLGVGDLGLTHVDEFIELMDRGRADVCQPDLSMVGGFTGVRRIARAARERGKRVIPHGYKTNILVAANLHFLANHDDEEVLEYSTSRSPLRWHTTRERFPVAEDGTVEVPDRPGLGVSLDWDFVKAHAQTARISARPHL
jgi:L-alanine-DL-glutamate epimerase-like enolase superfamily enzyme